MGKVVVFFAICSEEGFLCGPFPGYITRATDRDFDFEPGQLVLKVNGSCGIGRR
jgi:hypothetical protein